MPENPEHETRHLLAYDLFNRSSPDATGETLTGVIERIIFSNEETHYCIAELRSGDDQGPAIITGALPGVQCGETLRLEGEWVRHPAHGRQFKVRGFISELPATVYGIRKYLGSGLVPGIGRIYANKIVDHFGLDTFRVISDESALLRKVPGIGRRRAQAIKKAWDDQRAIREVMVFLQTHGVSPRQCLRLVNQYGDQAGEIIRNDPYRVAREIDGIGFKTADRIAINLGYANDSPARLDAGIIFALQEREGDGHTCFPEKDLGDLAAEMLQAPRDKIDERLHALVKAKALVRYLHPENGALLQQPLLDRCEERLARYLDALARGPSALPSIKVDVAIQWAQERAGFDFGMEQAEALRRALANKFAVITGGPGTGKTTILSALVSILKAKKARVQLAAPTGRAARRLAEATGAHAQTIHRLLKFDPSEGGFTAGEEQPLRTDYLIVDEASMLDVRLAAYLFRALPVCAHLLLVGDIDQLPSVGPGNVLRDLIDSGLPAVARLELIYRQKEKSLIARTAHAINKGVMEMPPKVRSVDDIDPAAEMVFAEAQSPEDCLAMILWLCKEIVPGRFGIDPLREAQILAPMHKGVVGVANLNQELQKALNGGSRSMTTAAGMFCVGDKLIQTRNNYDKLIFNGDLGAVINVEPEAGALTADFDGERHRFVRSELADLSLAYAISIHKSQGSEYPLVIVPLMKQHYMMLQRNLLYTAVTRGKRKVILIGDSAAYAMAVRNYTTRRRCTYLKERFGSKV